jgi:hypothetical protein
MKIGHGGYRRTPWSFWAIAFLTAIAVLPGAAIHASADEGTGNPKPVTSPAPVVQDWAANSQLEAHAPPPNMKYRVRYFVADILSKFREEEPVLSEPAAKEWLAQVIRGLVADPAGDQHNRPQPEQVRWFNDGNDLVVVATNAGHKRAADALNAFRKFGTSEQIAIEVRFFTLREEDHQKVFPDSTTAPLNVDEAAVANSDAVQPASFDHPLGSHEGTYIARAQSLIEKNEPMCLRVMDQRQGEELLIDRCQQDKQTNVLQAPKVTVFNGQTAFVSDTSQSQFVVGVIPTGPEALLQPQIRVVSEGTKLQLRPVADRSGAIHLDFAVTFSKIQKVETVTASSGPGGKPVTLQIPEVGTVRIEGGAVLKSGQWLLLAGSKKGQAAKAEVTPVSWKHWLIGHQEPRPTQELVLMLRAEKFDTPNSKRTE